MVITKKQLEKLVADKLIANRVKPVLVETASICLHLDNKFTSYDPYDGQPFTPPQTMPSTTKEIAQDSFIILPPGGKMLACTQEEVTMPYDMLGFIQTKGSLARGFLFTHMCDGQIDPGYKGRITLELLNCSDFYYKLVPGMPIASLFVFKTDEPVDHYDGRYQNSGGPTTMRGS
jgi:dCTP deaminase